MTIDVHKEVARSFAMIADPDTALDLAVVLVAIILREAPPEQRRAVGTLLAREAEQLLDGRP